MEWKRFVTEYLLKKQGGRCVGCGGGIRKQYQAIVKPNDRTTPLEDLKLVHRDCTAVNPRLELLHVQIEHLLNKGDHPSTIAAVLNISERTVWRHKAKKKERQNA